RTEFDTVEELTVGPKVTTLRPYMFAGCYGLQSVDMTNATSLTSISEYAFADITGITSVKVPWLTPITINENVFASGAYSSAILSVPAGTKEAYAAASIWENFTNIDHWSTLVTLTASTHGSIVTAEATASNGTEQYRQPKEDAVVYTLTADEGYELTALTDNDAAVSPLPTLGEEQTRANTEGEEFVTLNASFTPITYTLTYTLNGGTATNPDTYTIETTTFTLNNPTMVGYDFAGWKLNGVGEAMMTVTITQGSTGHLAYTATWTPTVYNIVYTMDGGTATPANPTTYTIETETFTLNNPTKTGHTFKGWKLNGEGDAMTTVTISQGSTGHLAYTATWQINKYTITFDSNGGSAVAPITQDYGTTVTAPDNPTKPGCDFAGWTPALPATMPAENITVTANWTVKTYTVSITGGGVSADNMNPKYGDDVVITIAEDEDRTLNTLTVNGEDVTAYVVDGQYTIHHVTGNVVVVATFNATKEFITLAQGVGTFSCAQDLNFTGSELKAYIAAGYNKAESQVLLVRVYDVPAGTGLYLKGEADVTYKIPYSTSQAYYVNMLKANLTASSIAKTSGDMSNFLLNKVDGEYGFFAPSETATLGAQKAYLQVPTSFMSGSEARAISIAFEDDGTTNISDFELFTNSNEHLYNLKGQRVEKAGRGLYIKNGKKVVIK
ncbi:MAG: InlB B-repeat-containing protein, partial [Prevotella sp.]|nr:InlB B-repeat-containing protein [Prevotella sp.]